MLLVLAPTPALERVALADPFLPGQPPKKPTRVLTYAGGTGLRMARVARALGSTVQAITFVGGRLGVLVRENLERDGISLLSVTTQIETRGDLLLLDRERGVVNSIPGPPSTVSPDEAERLLALLSQHLPNASMLLVGGDEKGLPDAFWSRAMRLAREHNIPILADVTGEALAEAVSAGVWLLRVNLQTFQRYTETSLMHDSAIVSEARKLLERGVQNVIVTLGEEGALLVNATGVWRVKPPVVSHFNPTGAGETLSGAFAARWEETEDFLDALRYGCAAASINVTHDAPAYATPGEVGILFPRTIAGPLPQ